MRVVGCQAVTDAMHCSDHRGMCSELLAQAPDMSAGITMLEAELFMVSCPRVVDSVYPTHPLNALPDMLMKDLLRKTERVMTTG